uniref:Uncharacterized protein n=1 Tax=Tetranychus urticae TaxID=32264 RepID=T1KHR7_TETUR
MMNKMCIVILIVSAIILSSVDCGDKKGTNIVIKDKHSQMILNTNKKGGDNIVIKDGCHKKEHHYVPHHEMVHGWGHGWGHGW